MLYIVQVVMWGVAEAPQLFPDEGKARAAFVECVRKQWGQRYGAYCEHHGVSADSFAAAEAFVKTIDVSEKSTVNYWTIAPEKAGPGTASTEGWSSLEEFRQVTSGIGALKEGLTRLLADVGQLAERCVRMADAPPVGEGAETQTPAAAAAAEEDAEAAPEAYTTPEWRNFAATIKMVCCGSRNQFHLLPRDAWRQDVYSNLTSLEYWDWLADRIRRYKEKAQKAGYTVIEEPDGYRFTSHEGIASEVCYDSEWEAWCAAGLHLKPRG